MAAAQDPDPFYKLSNIYRQLCKTRVVTDKDTSEEELQNFADILNSCLPTTEAETGAYNMIRRIYLASGTGPRNDFTQLLREKKLSHLCLYTEGKWIVNFLNVRYLVRLVWDNDEKIYHVQVNTNSSRRSDRTEISGETQELTRDPPHTSSSWGDMVSDD